MLWMPLYIMDKMQSENLTLRNYVYVSLETPIMLQICLLNNSLDSHLYNGKQEVKNNTNDAKI